MKLLKWLAEGIVDLERFAQVLNAIDATSELSNELTGAIGQIGGHAYHSLIDEANGRAFRRIRLPELPIVPPVANQLHPTGARITRATIRLVYDCYEQIDKKLKSGNDDLDRLRRADFQVCVCGELRFGSRLVELQDHWRIDTHIFEAGSPTEPHPRFHYQRGGHAQDEFSGGEGFVPGACLSEFDSSTVSLRGLMQTPAPRIAAPPMDPITAIDFVIAQHDGAIWRALRNMPEYDALVRKSQAKLWKPYFELVAKDPYRVSLMPFYRA